MANGVCKGCLNRQIGCHSHCELYLAEKEQRDKVKREILKRQAEEKAFRDVLYSDVPDKSKKEMRRRVAKLSKNI